MAEERKRVSRRDSVSSERLEILITIVNRKKAEFYMDLIQSFEVNMQCVAAAEGTANAQMLEMLGLTNMDKAVIFSVIKESRSRDALRLLEDKFKTIKDGKGIACTVSMSSVIGVSVFAFLSNNKAMAEGMTRQPNAGKG